MRSRSAISSSTHSSPKTASLSNSGTSTNAIVQRVSGASLTAAEFFQHYQKPGIPVIITGLLDAEPDWNLDYLCQQLGDQPFPVRQYGRDRYQQDKRQWTSSGSGVPAITLSFSEYADRLRNGTVRDQDLYLARCSLQQTPLSQLPNLTQAENQLGLRLPATALNLWVGLGGHTSCLHYDPMDGTLVQLHGAKKILLFPPSQLYNLYPFPVIKHLYHGLKLRAVYSQVYPERPDLEAFPKFQHAIPYAQEITLYPKEILFLPSGWWHEVTALGEEMVCSINRFWHVLPLSRAFSSWSKWRAHLGGVLAAPHIFGNVMGAISSGNRQGELSKLIQRL
ncbi:cupin-like domain-containing protein [Thermocoleostomius sinensis]|uniref:Cupin-like domain-containing protein n=1 Tax=Thermocoleostomius sinensis A174 TaxID=2016057 RepID=A0A9E8ZNK0_9CYAN|nr:cupin-like domain-containing protein [Thermocoleostomius sinensis]WAL61841.1 cupin-like domain-containing protein [Thermocoleostomius sinensis A174]